MDLGFKPNKLLLGPVCLPPCLPNSNEQQSHLEGLLKSRFLGPTPRVSDSFGLGWGPRTCVPNRFPEVDNSGCCVGAPVWLYYSEPKASEGTRGHQGEYTGIPWSRVHPLDLCCHTCQFWWWQRLPHRQPQSQMIFNRHKMGFI